VHRVDPDALGGQLDAPDHPRRGMSIGAAEALLFAIGGQSLLMRFLRTWGRNHPRNTP
jgi:hypothetical protein